MRRPAVLAVVGALALACAGSAPAISAPWQPDAPPAISAPWQPDAPAATALALTGDLSTHDPALVAGAGGQPWYVFSTGNAQVAGGSIQIRTSTDGLAWTDAGTVWDAATRPMWVSDVVPGVSNFWAPEIFEHDGTWYLYYAASTFGTNNSVIGLYTNTTLDRADPNYAWVDRGEVIRSQPEVTNYNAIDPGIIQDANGTPWMAFGSFWGGIQVVELTWPSGLLAHPGAQPVTIASRPAPDAIEAPYLVAHDGFIYLFVSRDACCRGTDSTYNIAVGRATAVTGPYLDRAGEDMKLSGGTLLLGSRGDMIGPGGQSVSGGYLAFHYYDASLGGAFQLAIRQLAWDADGWPVATTTGEQAGG